MIVSRDHGVMLGLAVCSYSMSIFRFLLGVLVRHCYVREAKRLVLPQVMV